MRFIILENVSLTHEIMTHYLVTNFEKKKFGKYSISFYVLVKINFRVVGSPLWMVDFCMPYWILIWLFPMPAKCINTGRAQQVKAGILLWTRKPIMSKKITFQL
jgi:hypothetical protein